MGIPKLLAACKEGASRDIVLGRGGPGSVIIIDGCFMLHRFVGDEGVAAALLHADDVLPLARSCIKLVRRLMDFEWAVVVVFDGASPPAKEGTRVTRRRAREWARERLKAATTAAERDKATKLSVSLDERVIARVAALVSLNCCGCQTLTAPFEADAQLVLLEQTLLETNDRTYIYGNDSDLIVLGARCLLWDIKSSLDQHGSLVGSVVEREMILRPPPWLLADDKAGAFLRKLHGVDRDDKTPVLLPADIVNARLVDLACVSGNDYIKFKGVALASGARIALPKISGPDYVIRGEAATVRALSDGLRVKVSDITEEEAEAAIWIPRIMFLHSVVWDMHTGKQYRVTPLQGRSREAEAAAEECSG